MKDSKIEWTNHTFNPWIGCTKVSPGCANCYAERIGGRVGVRWGRGELRRRNKWESPIAWNRSATRRGERDMVFCGSLCDVFDEEVPDQWREELFEQVIIPCTSLDWQLLTKRPIKAREWLSGRSWPHVWLGTSVENQTRAGDRVPVLLETPSPVRFLSMEPLLGPVDLDAWIDRLDWVIVGGESGPGWRPMEADWVRSLRDQTKSAGKLFFFKQWAGHRKPEAPPQLDGRQWVEIPELRRCGWRGAALKVHL